jgi:hypothetical protein
MTTHKNNNIEPIKQYVKEEGKSGNPHTGKSLIKIKKAQKKIFSPPLLFLPPPSFPASFSLLFLLHRLCLCASVKSKVSFSLVPYYGAISDYTCMCVYIYYNIFILFLHVQIHFLALQLTLAMMR